jgi:hypothetical protein
MILAARAADMASAFAFERLQPGVDVLGALKSCGGVPEELTPSGDGGSEDLPPLNITVAGGLGRRAEVIGEFVPQEERLGLVRCWRKGGRPPIEWTTKEVGVYAAATGPHPGALYDWWRRNAGPEA